MPSITPDATQERDGLQALEERMLFLLFLLRKPRMRVIYVTGRPVPESVVEYYLGLLPGVIPRQARAPAAHGRDARRLGAVAGGEAARAAARAGGDPRADPRPGAQPSVPYATTALERDLALMLGIPLYGADPAHLPLGTKTGCRRLFAEAGVHAPARLRGHSRRR